MARGARVGLCGSRPVSADRRARRTRAEQEALETTIVETAHAEHPMTLRGLFYRLVSAGAIEKTERAYKRVVQVVTKLRRADELPYSWFVDGTRWQRKPTTHDSLRSMLDEQTRLYRRALWSEQSTYLEVWSEKEAIAGLLYEETQRWDVPLMVCRGYPSLSFLHAAGDAIEAVAKPTTIAYFGDLDPSGLDIARVVEQELRRFAPGADIEFQRVAVTREQVEAMRLATRPTKQTDTRSRGFEGESVEVDAIAPRALRQIARECIEGRIDPDVLRRTLAVEEAERRTLEQIAANLSGGGAEAVH